MNNEAMMVNTICPPFRTIVIAGWKSIVAWTVFNPHDSSRTCPSTDGEDATVCLKNKGEQCRFGRG